MYYLSGLLKFLSKLRTTAEFQRPETRPGLARRVVEVFETILRDPFAREEVLLRCVDSVDRCGDKTIWALNQLMITARVARARGNRAMLRDLGLALMRLDLVHARARQKIDSLGGDVDDVCVYLKFEIALREALDLPVSAQHMLFPAYIKIKKREFALVRDEALAITDAELDAWLESWPEWQRQVRQEAAQRLEWRDLEPIKLNKRLSLSLTTLMGDPLTQPVMLNKAGPWEFAEIIERWTVTGLDFNNVRWPLKDFLSAIKRVELPPDHAPLRNSMRGAPRD